MATHRGPNDLLVIQEDPTPEPTQAPEPEPTLEEAKATLVNEKEDVTIAKKLVKAIKSKAK